MKLSRKVKWCSAGVGCLILLPAVVAFWPFRFGYDSVCSQCGAIRSTAEWHVPYSERYLFTYSVVETTPVSRYLTSSGLVTAHSHHWLFGHGGGNGVRCALGDGDKIRATVMSPKAARFLALTREYGGREDTTKVLRFTFDPDLSPMVLNLADFVPTNGFSGRDQYRSWISDQAWFIEQAVELAKQNRGRTP